MRLPGACRICGLTYPDWEKERAEALAQSLFFQKAVGKHAIAGIRCPVLGMKLTGPRSPRTQWEPCETRTI